MNNTKYTLRPIGLDITYFAYRPRVYILHWPSTPTISSESGPSASHLFIPLARDLVFAFHSSPLSCLGLLLNVVKNTGSNEFCHCISYMGFCHVVTMFCFILILYIPYSSTDRRNYNRRLLVIRKCQFSTQELKLLMH